MGQNLRHTEPLLDALARVVTGEKAKLGWSVEALAEEADIPYGTLRKYLRGEGAMDIAQFWRLAAVFNMTGLELMEAVVAEQAKHPDRPSLRIPRARDEQK